ncbi:hypothetical protein P9D39_16240 [Heyndrickxia oleronia]|uniref:Uncharacterized protein n=1 Tax=Heyndrickxia oleronia TaxID=38875 RepID=A0A8E2IB51_9BACI|nr:hypothetical protein [Heyndrickxia oleronia]MEC1375841.1 hypothetical protein [Heyndrickxia oleronia]OOP67715.1 hypothetical protein BWZ43_14380 [Heyndrickxia oleronia]QQZ05559.1 hypothetical protein I5818_03420 [Heyndrickxia oleronia]
MLFPNIPTKTLGGNVFWETLDYKKGWKLQRNIFSEHYRILDPKQIRQAWGYNESEIRESFRTFTEGNNYNNNW